MRIDRIVPSLLISVLVCGTANSQTTAQTNGTHVNNVVKPEKDNVNENSAESVLHRGLFLSDLYNWSGARPYLLKAKELFEEKGDKRNALYAELAAMRAGADPSSLSELSYKASQELEMNPILQSDKELRMFCLIVKGELDGEVSSAAMRQDWS